LAWRVLRSEFRHRQVRGVLLQRLIDDERAAAGLHGLELIGGNELINADLPMIAEAWLIGTNIG
jgi:hypothetical protein